MRFSLSANVLLWVLQSFLAAFFALASGAPKLLLPAEALPMPIPLPQTFMWFVGTVEVLGGLGLILPGITRIRPSLTPIAAACLVALTVCAATYQLIGQQPGNAAFAVGMGALCAVVAIMRPRVAARDSAMVAASAA